MAEQPTRIELWTGGRAADRLARASSWLAARGSATELLVIGPDPGVARDFVHAVLGQRGALFGWRYTGLVGLARELALGELAGAGATPIAGAVREAVVARVLSRLDRAGRLGRFAPVADSPGLPRAIARTLVELGMAGVDADRLTAQPGLAEILRGYRDELVALGFADRDAVFAAAIRTAERGEHGLVGLPALLLDVEVATRREADLIAALAGAGGELCVTVPRGDEPGLRRLSEALGCEPGPAAAAPPSGPGADALARVQDRLFSADQIAPAPGDPSVVLFSAPGESRECVEIARAVLGHAAAGVRFDRMAVLLHSPPGYRAHLVEALRRAEVPAYFSHGTLRPDPAGRAILALLGCAAEGLSARGFAEYLSLSVVPDPDPDGSPPPAPGDRFVSPEELPGLLELGGWEDRTSSGRSGANVAVGEPELARVPEPGSVDPEAPVVEGVLRAPRRWEKLVVDASVIGSLDRWRRRLSGLARELELDRDRAESPEARAALERRLADLDGLRRFALPLLELLERLPDAATWGEWLDRLGELASRALRQPERVLRVLSELAPMAPVGPVTLGEVQRLLAGRLGELAVSSGRAGAGQLFVGSVAEARGRSFEVVFVPGLAERVFPHKVVEDPILLDQARAAISPDLARNADRIAAERLALHLAVGAAERALVLSYPRIDGDQARPRVPSFYGLELLRAAEGHLPGFEQLSRRAEAAAGARMRWPAPVCADHAIDDAEYDLAVLEQLIDDPEASRGAARYLLEANHHLARALRFRARRWGLTQWTGADGLVGPSPAARAALEKHQLGARAYSPTALQRFATCPYSFFLGAILGLAPREVPAAIEQLDPVRRGSLIHEVQFELLQNLAAAGRLPLASADLDHAQRLLDQTLREVGERYRDQLAPAIVRVWDDGIAAIRRDLVEWLRRGATGDWVPRHFELAFGLRDREGRDPASVEEAVALDCGITVRGSIDLVEARSGTLRATDHKTGRPPPALAGLVIGGGKVLQPVVYGLALEKIFAGQPVGAGRLYYCTDRGGFAAREVDLDDRARAAMALVAAALGQALEAGFLPAAPEPGACQRCDYWGVCGPYEELRTARKKGGLGRLTELRSHP